MLVRALQGACRESTTMFVASKGVCMIFQGVCSGRFLVADDALFTRCFVLANAVKWFMVSYSKLTN